MLGDFKSFVAGMDSKTAGWAIGQSEPIRRAHNSFTRPKPFVMEERAATKEKDEVLHFIAYIPFGGSLWELDSLKQGPIRLGALTGDLPWYEQILPHIQQRIARYESNKIKFNLMAVIHDRQEVLQERVEQLEGQLAMSEDEGIRSALQGEISQLKQDLAEEKRKHENWKQENIRRKHNYVPFLVNMLKVLANNGQLERMMPDEGKTRFELEQIFAAKAKNERPRSKGQKGKAKKAKAS